MRATLKANLNRTVLLEREQGREVVIKRFHSPGALRRLTDRRRATREFRVLSRLRERGLPVPAPLELRKAGDHWEVVLEWIPDAHPFDELLRGEHPLPIAPDRLARRLARLLARTWEVGLVHSDLHAGNVLIDASGHPWLVDFQHARLRDSVPARRRQRDLVVLAAGTREVVAPGFRARFLVELLRALGDEGAATLGDAAQLARLVEEEARLHRRHRVHRRQLRWTRESSDCTAYHAGSLRGWIRRGLDARELAAVAELAESRDTSGAHLRENGYEIREVARDGHSWLIVRAQEEPVLREAWYAAARVREHGLPGPDPVLLLEEPEPLVLLRDAGLGAPLVRALADLGESERARLRTELLGLLGALHDRGLALGDLSAETFRTRGASPVLGAPLELVAATPARRRRDRGAALDLVRADDDAAWRDAYCRAWRGARAERAELRAELEGD